MNWAGTVRTRPAAWHEPVDHDAVAEVVRAAARSGRRVRVVGAGHSWSDIAAPHDIAISLDRLQGIRAIERARDRVIVSGGTRIRQLNELLAKEGLALPVVGSVDHQSIAGAIATATHGSSLVHGNLASLAEGFRLVTGRGRTVSIGDGDERLDGARVSLGALGIVTEVTLRVLPAFRLAETVERVPVESVRSRLEDIAHSAEYVKLWWFPHTTDALVFRYARTNDPESRRPSPQTQRWFDEVVLQGQLFRGVLALERLRPAWIPAFNRVLAKTFERERRVGDSYAMLGTPMPVVHRETEAALPLERAGEAFDRVVRLVEREALRVNVLVEARFVRGDAGWMSPAHGIDTCQLGAYMGGVPGVDRYFAAFWREMRELGARPHWGKEHDFGAAEVRERFPQAMRFLALRHELDPERTFGTPFHAHTLGA